MVQHRAIQLHHLVQLALTPHVAGKQNTHLSFIEQVSSTSAFCITDEVKALVVSMCTVQSIRASQLTAAIDIHSQHHVSAMEHALMTGWGMADWQQNISSGLQY